MPAPDLSMPPIPLSNFGNPESPIRQSGHALRGRSCLFRSWTVDTKDDALESHNCESESGASTGPRPRWSDKEKEKPEEPAALLDYFASCRKGGDGSYQKEAMFQSESEDDDFLDSTEDEELGDVDDLLKYLEYHSRFLRFGKDIHSSEQYDQ